MNEAELERWQEFLGRVRAAGTHPATGLTIPNVEIEDLSIEIKDDRVVYRAGNLTTHSPLVALRTLLLAWKQDKARTQARLDHLERTLNAVRRKVGRCGSS